MEHCNLEILLSDVFSPSLSPLSPRSNNSGFSARYLSASAYAEPGFQTYSEYRESDFLPSFFSVSASAASAASAASDFQTYSQPDLLELLLPSLSPGICPWNQDVSFLDDYISELRDDLPAMESQKEEEKEGYNAFDICCNDYIDYTYHHKDYKVNRDCINCTDCNNCRDRQNCKDCEGCEDCKEYKEFKECKDHVDIKKEEKEEEEEEYRKQGSHGLQLLVDNPMEFVSHGSEDKRRNASTDFMESMVSMTRKREGRKENEEVGKGGKVVQGGKIGEGLKVGEREGEEHPFLLHLLVDNEMKSGVPVLDEEGKKGGGRTYGSMDALDFMESFAPMDSKLASIKESTVVGMEDDGEKKKGYEKAKLFTKKLFESIETTASTMTMETLHSMKSTTSFEKEEKNNVKSVVYLNPTTVSMSGPSNPGSLSITVPYPPTLNNVAIMNSFAPVSSRHVAFLKNPSSERKGFQDVNGFVEDEEVWKPQQSSTPDSLWNNKPWLPYKAGAGTGTGTGTSHNFTRVKKDSSLLAWIKKFEEGGPVVNQDGKMAIVCNGNCQVLRRVIHSNGVHDTRLEFHFSRLRGHHAVLHTRKSCDNGCLAVLEQQVEEMPAGSAESSIAQFLLRYNLIRESDSFFLCYDSCAPNLDESDAPNSSPSMGTGTGISILQKCLQPFFNDSVYGRPGTCTSTGQSFILSGTNPSTEYSSKTTICHSEISEIQRIESCDSIKTTPNLQNLGNKSQKTIAAEQRERTSKLRVEDLAKHFHLPINLAAKALGICPTVLKKICRRNNMRRWPHRKIKSIERIISTLEQTLFEGVSSGEESIRAEIKQLKKEKENLFAGILGDL